MIVEPVAANMGVVPPAAGFLEGPFAASPNADGALLVFDEVITGFRLAYGGAQNVFGVHPDLTMLGKIIGGGLPVAAYGGRREIMESDCAARPRLSGGHAFGQSARDARRSGLAAASRTAPVFTSRLDKKAQRLAQGLRERSPI